MTTSIEGRGLDHPLHLVTPLLKSKKLSKVTGCSVWLKLDNVQNSGSFKVVGNGCTQLVSSSGGNAGLAAIYCAQELGVPITVVVPEPTPQFIVDKMREEGATVEVVGKVWDEANVRALEIAAQPGASLIHPFDHPDIWCGHASMVEEIQAQLHGLTPDLVVVSVGGGGLMCGVLEGLHRVGWVNVPVLAMETHGADSFNACAQTGEWVTLDNISSIARCLGAKRVCRKAYEWLSRHTVISQVVSDRDAVSACVRIADDHRILVPPACGATLAAVYGDTIKQLQQQGKLPHEMKDIVVIVCGGSGVNLDTIQQWRMQYNIL